MDVKNANVPVPVDPPKEPAAPKKDLKVEDALLYLDQVKTEFASQPSIYNQFLDIMKNFKAQAINTPGVIETVKRLFKGHSKLILGFNAFLPDGAGYKIELTAEEIEADKQYAIANRVVAPVVTTVGSLSSFQTRPGPGYQQQSAAAMQQRLDAQKAQQMEAQRKANMTNNSQSGFNPHRMSIPLDHNRPGYIPPPSGPPAGVPLQALSQQQQQSHAIKYVTKIRERFNTDPEVYRSFLKILHTYQKEQKGIKEVLEQVSALFADHPDLLMEFTYFLPDNVQAEAKERLTRAVKESEIRKAQKIAILAQMKQTTKNQLIGKTSETPKIMGDHLTQHETGANGKKRPRAEPKLTAAAMKKQALEEHNDKHNETAKKQAKVRPGSAQEKAIKERAALDRDNRIRIDRVFSAIKLAIAPEFWVSFVKAMELFVNDAIQQDELQSLVEDLLVLKSPEGVMDAELQREFKRLLANRSDYDVRKQDVRFAVPLPVPVTVPPPSGESSAENTVPPQCRKCTPSHRAEIGGEMSALERAVVLAKIEDEKYEMDALLDSNDRTITALQSAEAEYSLFPLDANHRAAIARLYGEAHCVEILDLLRKNPVGSIPVVLKRLRQKGVEWKAVRLDMLAAHTTLLSQLNAVNVKVEIKSESTVQNVLTEIVTSVHDSGSGSEKMAVVV